MRAFTLRFGALMLFLAVGASAQMERAELASLRQDVMLLTQRVGELTMTVEQLTRENSALQDKANRSYATVEQLNKAIADVNRTLESELVDQKREILAQVAGQLEKLGKQTNAALDALAKSQATRPVVQTTFAEDFPKEGINYTVQSGDTLAVIARKNGAKLQDIINANKIADPTKIRVGQTLFIPLAK
ncbi:LysM peptidoglycan-binding domain-containing protein [Oleiharenicola lentus]|jgi:LysM repeat protein|nr:LysM peptidoglycan-binding domain-containing protein [Oleiharenicola lentus]